MANTTNQNYPKPVETTDLSVDVSTFQTAFDMIDLDVKSLLTAMDGKAPTAHGHAVADVVGLQGDLDGKALTGHTHALDDLTDVDGAAGAADGMLLQKTPVGFVPVSVSAAVGADVTALVDAGLAAKMDKSANFGDVPPYNWLDNSNLTINQRNGTRTPGVGNYGYDRWKGHASGLEQVVEALPAGEYTLTWTGGGSGTFGGTTTTSPFKATVTAGNASVIVPSAATKISLVRGDHTTGPDPWVELPDAQELWRCRRFYRKIYGYVIGPAQVNGVSNGGHISFDPPMNGAPSVTPSSATNSRAGATVYLSITPEKMQFYAPVESATTNGSSQVFVDAWADADL